MSDSRQSSGISSRSSAVLFRHPPMLRGPLDRDGREQLTGESSTEDVSSMREELLLLCKKDLLPREGRRYARDCSLLSD